MALFERKLKKETKDAAPKKEGRSRASGSTTPASHARVLIRPRITEKAANMTAVHVYTFDIAKSATKGQVVEAVKALYKVTPVKVNVVNVRGKKVAMRRKRGFGMSASSRKAYVYLKKGEEIQFA
jgi:large subunit ribosomal protein L23